VVANKKKYLWNYFEIGSVSASVVLKNLPFVLFLGFLAVIYIANTHFAEKQVREIQILQREVKELKRQYNSLKSDLMFESRLSEIGEEVARMGLKKSAGRVKIIKAED
jgi:cell division protein FtsB